MSLLKYANTGPTLAHRERSKSMNRLPFTRSRGSTGVTKALIVSNKVTVKRSRYTDRCTGKKILEIYTGFPRKATRRTCWRGSDQTSNRNSIMNFYRLLRLFKTSYFGLGAQWLVFAMCAGVTVWKGWRCTLTSLKVFSRTEMNWLESNFITRWRMKPLSRAQLKDTGPKQKRTSIVRHQSAWVLMRLELQNICHLLERTSNGFEWE